MALWDSVFNVPYTSSLSCVSDYLFIIKCICNFTGSSSCCVLHKTCYYFLAHWWRLDTTECVDRSLVSSIRGDAFNLLVC